jgi:Uncharacterized protein conserved in bacteria (DUF2188)
MTKKPVHNVPHQDDGWANRSEGNKRVTETFNRWRWMFDVDTTRRVVRENASNLDPKAAERE